jgi:hypothetical protein
MSLPEKPWTDGDTFVNEETGVEYTFDGEKWLAGGGGEADDATLALINEVDRTSQMRDEVLDAKIDQESNLNTVAHLKLEDQILRCYAWSEGDNESLERKLTKVDEGLQAQIDDLPTTEYVDTGDRTLQGEIDQIALALEALLVQREHGKWSYVGLVIDNRPSRPGQWALESDISQSTNYLAINQVDMDGVSHGWGDISIGDYVEVVDLDNPDNYALFVIDDEPDGTGFTFFEVKLKDRGGEFSIGEACEIRFFQVNEQDLQLEDLDRRYLKKAGGDNMEGPLHVKGHSGDSRGTSRIKTLGVFSESNSALRLGTTTDRIYIEDENTKFNGGILVNNIGPKTEDGRGVTLNVEGTNDKHLITKKYVDTATDLDDRYLKLSGGTMAGSATLKVNVLEPVNTPMIQYNGDPDSTHAAGLINREMMRRYVAAELDKAPQSSPPISAKLMVGFQVWSEGRLSEGCFNLLDENKQAISKIKSARFLTFHIIQSWDYVEWFKHELRGKGQIHLTDKDGKYLMSKFVIGAEKREAGSGDDPVDALWFFELEEYGFDVDVTLSGNYFMEFDSCLEQV